MLRMRNLSILFILLSLSAVPAVTRASETPWLASGLKAQTRIAELGYLNDAPAGKHGFLQVAGEDFIFADGEKARFWGIALSAGACFPDKKDAPEIAARLASLGFNMVRLHHMDAPWAGRGLIDYRRNDSRHFDRTNWDRLDFFINELKQVGIYIFLDLLVTREFREGDGVRNAASLPHMGKGASFIDPHLIELQKDYASNLWTHRNPYTGLRYLDDPVFALSLICNENDLTSHFFLLPEHAPDHPELSRAYIKRLDDYARVNNFSPSKTRRVWESPEARRATTVMMTSFFVEMRRYLRDLGVKVPITGTNWAIHLHDLPALASMDFMDQHIYAEGELDEAEFSRSVDAPAATLQWLPFSRVKGKPFVISEWNKGYPMRYRGEYPLVFAAVAAAQQWNVAIMYAYSHDTWTMPQLHHPFDVIVDPARLPLLPAAALLFRRAVQPLTERALIKVTEQELYSDAFAPRQMSALTTGLWQKRLSLSWRPGDQGLSPTTRLLPLQAQRSKSLDGQLFWDWENDYRQINTSQVQAFIGWGDGRTVRSEDVEWTFGNRFVAAALAAVGDGETALPQADKLLLVLSTQAQNTAASYPDENGIKPVVLEAPVGKIRLRHNAKVLSYRMLTAAGVWREGGRLVRGADGWFSLRLDPVVGALVYELNTDFVDVSVLLNQLMQGDFRLAEKARRIGRGAGAPRGVAEHLVRLPAARYVAPGAGTVGQDRNLSRQADLAAMGMPAEIKPGPGSDRFGNDFGGMCQEDFECIRRDSGAGCSEVMSPVEVGVVDTEEVQRLSLATNRQGFIEQHAQAATLEVGHLFDKIVITQDAVDSVPAGEVRQQALHPGQGYAVITGGAETEIPGYDAEVEALFLHQFSKFCTAVGHAIDMQVGQVQDAQVMKGGWEVGKRRPVFYDSKVDGVAEAAFFKTEYFEPEVEQDRDQAQVLPVPTTHASTISGGRDPQLRLQALCKEILAKALFEGEKFLLFHKSPDCWSRLASAREGLVDSDDSGQCLIMEVIS
jgi:hypothetical protein